MLRISSKWIEIQSISEPAGGRGQCRGKVYREQIIKNI